MLKDLQYFLFLKAWKHHVLFEVIKLLCLESDKVIIIVHQSRKMVDDKSFIIFHNSINSLTKYKVSPYQRSYWL